MRHDRSKLPEHLKRVAQYPYVLLAIHQLGGSADKNDATRKTLSFHDIDDDIYKLTTSDGTPLVEKEVQFSRQHLFDTGYIGKGGRGIWTLTNKALNIIPALETKRQAEFEKFIEFVAQEYKYYLKNHTAPSRKHKKAGRSSQNGEFLDIEHYANDLAVVMDISPSAFEELCKRLFEKVGYVNVITTPDTRDGGFDGLGYLLMGLTKMKVAFESKRWAGKSTVGVDKIRQLSGTMKKIRAEKGVFITTSNFTGDAVEEASDLDIELIDGETLVGLLQEYGLGFSKHTQYTINEDYFKKL